MKKIFSKNYISVLAYLFAFLVVIIPMTSLAAGLNTDGTSAPGGALPTLQDPLGKNGRALEFREIVPRVMDALLQVGAVVIALAFIYAGFKYVTALGDEKAITKAHEIFKYTAIGAALLLGSSVIAQAIKGTIEALQTANK